MPARWYGTDTSGCRSVAVRLSLSLSHTLAFKGTTPINQSRTAAPFTHVWPAVPVEATCASSRPPHVYLSAAASRSHPNERQKQPMHDLLSCQTSPDKSVPCPRVASTPTACVCAAATAALFGGEGLVLRLSGRPASAPKQHYRHSRQPLRSWLGDD